MMCGPVSLGTSPYWPIFGHIHVFLAVVVIRGIELSILWEERVLKILELFHDSIYCFAYGQDTEPKSI